MAAKTIPLIGYSDKLSVRPGETIAFKISCTSSEPYDAKLVRITCGDPNPAGPGIKETEIHSGFTGPHPSRLQGVPLGSYARIVPGSAFDGVDALTFSATIWPTRLKKEGQAVISKFDPEAGSGMAVLVGPNGVELIVGRNGSVPFKLATDKPLQDRQWYRVWGSVDADTGEVIVGQQRLGGESVRESAPNVNAIALDSNVPILIGALGNEPPSGYFNGKVEAPKIHGAAIDPTDSDANLMAHWDFSNAISSNRVVDAGPLMLHGHVVNAPARAMTGSNWLGEEMRWQHAPETYGAIHFHEDDIEDCGWQTDFELTIPDDMRTGLYAARLKSGDNWEALPFVVCPPKGTQNADLCLVISTFTYTIYGNQARRDFDTNWTRRAKEWGAFPYNPFEHREYGLFTYNFPACA